MERRTVAHKLDGPDFTHIWICRMGENRGFENGNESFLSQRSIMKGRGGLWLGLLQLNGDFYGEFHGIKFYVTPSILLTW